MSGGKDQKKFWVFLSVTDVTCEVKVEDSVTSKETKEKESLTVFK